MKGCGLVERAAALGIDGWPKRQKKREVDADAETRWGG
jgi:hypothetical protein